MSSAFEILRLLQDAHRGPLLRQLANHAAYLRANRIPIEFLARLYPGIVDAPASVDVSFDHHFSLPYGERAILSALVAHLRPAVTFEFGTFTGATTRMIADLLPATSVVHTLELPDEQMRWPVGGHDFHGRAEYNGRIVLHRAPSRLFDFTPFTAAVDLVFVDASHEFDDVMHDSRRALDMVSDNGIVVWDDYQARTMDVVRALNQLSREVQLVRVAYSRLVIFRRRPFPDVGPVNATPWVEHPPRDSPLTGV